MDRRTIDLAADFEAATQAQWLALAEKSLKGAGLGSLFSQTTDGLKVAPLYTAANSAAPFDFEPAARAQERAWDVRAPVRHPDPALANAQILDALRGGAASVVVRIDPSGDNGVAVGSAEGMARMVAGVMTEAAPVALDAGFLGACCADWLAAAVKASPTAPLAFHLDPLSRFASAGASQGPIESHVAACAAAAARLREPYPRASLFLASGRAAHEAGGGEAEEIAFAAASALAYAKAMVAEGLSAQAAFEAIVLGLSLDADTFLTIAKLRAARVVWARITGACGVRAPTRIEARSSGRMLTRTEAWTNLVRLTLAGFAGAVGGADAIILDAFTDALGPPTAFALRQSRNAQLILMEEAGVGRVADPAAGSWCVETLTAELAAAAWGHFQAIEAAGGIVRALQEGIIADEVARARSAAAAMLAKGALHIVGVTDFKGGDAPVPEVDAPATQATSAPASRLPGPDSRCPPLGAIRLEDLA